jgi:hypothetical protein
MLLDTWVNAGTRPKTASPQRDQSAQKPAPRAERDGQAIRSRNISSRIRNSLMWPIFNLFSCHTIYSHICARCARSCLVPTEAIAHYLIYQKGVSHNCAGQADHTSAGRGHGRSQFLLSRPIVFCCSAEHTEINPD